MTKIKTNYENINLYQGERVRATYNPQTGVWHIYDLDNDSLLFKCYKIELHTVGLAEEKNEKYAPNGSPSFIGTVSGQMLMDDIECNSIGGKYNMLLTNSFCPYKVYFIGSEGPKEFIQCRRILLKGCYMYADTRNVRKEEHEK